MTKVAAPYVFLQSLTSGASLKCMCATCARCAWRSDGLGGSFRTGAHGSTLFHFLGWQRWDAHFPSWPLAQRLGSCTAAALQLLPPASLGTLGKRAIIVTARPPGGRHVGGGVTKARVGQVALPGCAPGTVLVAGGAGVSIGNFLYILWPLGLCCVCLP
jgi:hypothetical protein